MPSMNRLSHTLSLPQIFRPKLLLCVLTCVLATPLVFSGAAIAGDEAVTHNDSGGAGVADNFGRRIDRPRTSIEEGSLAVLRTIENRSSVPSVDGDRQSISPEAVSTIRASLQANSRTNLESTLTQLEQQLTNEMGAPVFEVARISNSPSELRSAVSATNRLINGLDSQQLAAASQSPTFLSLVQLLRNANAMLNGDPEIGFNEGGGEFGLLGLRPVSQRPARPEPTPQPQRPVVPELPPAPPTPQTSAPLPPVAPAAQEPIRGLW